MRVQGNTRLKLPAKLIVPAGDFAPVAIADSGSSSAILPSTDLANNNKDARTVTLRLAPGEVEALEHRTEIYADHASIPVSFGSSDPQTKGGTAYGLMRCRVPCACLCLSRPASLTQKGPDPSLLERRKP